MTDLTAKRLKELLHYDPKTGIFRWKARRSGVTVGTIAGRSNQKGRIQIKINGRNYSANRLAFLWMKGKWPKNKVDHKDLNPSNNRWRNLREATDRQNCWNRKLSPLSTSGFKCVSVDKVYGRASAYITIDGKRKHLGSFDTPEEAHAVYRKTARKAFGRFARFE